MSASDPTRPASGATAPAGPRAAAATSAVRPSVSLRPGETRRALRPGTPLGDYRVESVLDEGPLSITYLASDPSLSRRVVIKEHFPILLLERNEDQTLSLRSPASERLAARALDAFVQETRRLAQVDHPSLARVLRFWQTQHSAYLVMPSYEGMSLQQAREAMPRPPTEAWLRELLERLAGGVEALHQAGCLHAQIRPEHILLLQDGRPLLLDPVGLHHEPESGQAAALDAVSPYAAIEQYAPAEAVLAGPWTDVYALGAVAFFCITGQPPPAATVRAARDGQALLAEAVHALRKTWPQFAYRAPLLAVIDQALALRPQERPASVAQFRAAVLASGEAGAAGRSTPAAMPTAGAGMAFSPLVAAGEPPADEGRGLPSGEQPAARPAPPAVPPPSSSTPSSSRPADGSWAASRFGTTLQEPTLGPAGRRSELSSSDDMAARPYRPPGSDATRGRSWPLIAGSALVMAGLMAAVWHWQQNLRADRALSSLAGEMRRDAPFGASPGALPGAAAGGDAVHADGTAAAGSAAPDGGSPMALPAEATRAGTNDSLPDAASPSPTETEAPAGNVERDMPVTAGTDGGEEVIADERPSTPQAAAANSAPPRPAAAAPAAAATTAFSSPREACLPRSNFALYRCMQAQCERTRFYAHPQCRLLREENDLTSGGSAGSPSLGTLGREADNVAID